MNLAEYQSAVMRVSFDLAPSPEDLAALGSESRWRMYRHMVRTRLENMAKVAFKATLALSGQEAFQATFDRYLAEHAPQSRLIRQVIADFGTFALGDEALHGRAPCLHDMLRFERAKWEVAYEPATWPVLGQAGVRELDFEGALVLNPVLRVLSLSHPVHREDESAWTTQTPVGLLLYRVPGADDVRWWAAGSLFAAVLERSLEQPREAVAEVVRRVARDHQRALDQGLLEELSDALTLGLQRSVVVGVR